MRREEQQICQERLQNAHDQWFKEKKRMEEEAEIRMNLEIDRKCMECEQSLRKEFDDTKRMLQEDSGRKLKEELVKAWKTAEEEKEKAIEKTREGEIRKAKAAAIKVNQQVEEQRRQDSLRAKEDTRIALREQEEELEIKSRAEMERLKTELMGQHELEVMKILEEHQMVQATAQQVYYDKVLENTKLRQELHDMINDRDHWKEKHDDLKQEFSNFIDQFPGFRGEFLLK